MRLTILLTIILLSVPAWAEGRPPRPNGVTGISSVTDVDISVSAAGEAEAIDRDGGGPAINISQSVPKRASSAADLYLGSGCANEGVSGQGVQFGAAVGGESRDCKAMRLAAAWESSSCDQRAGSGPCTILARELDSFNDEYYGGWIFGSLLRGLKNHVMNPILQLIPWIGQGA